MKKTELNPTVKTIAYTAITLGPKLGEGGFGDVYKASYLAADVAVKKLKGETLDEQAKAEFLKESTLMADLRSSYIVQLYGVCTQPYAIVMEYMPKGSLFHLLHTKDTPPLPWTLRYSISLDIGKGIHFLHSQEPPIVHRDLKSLNVLLDQHYRAKLCDFGLAKIKQHSQSTSTLHFKGTMGWAAPELFEDKPAYTPQSDIYAYGMILWELTSLQIPFATLSPMQLTRKLLKGERETIPADAPPAFKEAIKASWQDDTQQRPAALEVVTTLAKGQVLLAEEENKAKTLAPVKATAVVIPPNSSTESLSVLASSGPQYQSMLSDAQSRLSGKTSATLPAPFKEASKLTLSDPGPQYMSQLPSQALTPINPGKQEVTTSGPQYLSSLNAMADLIITVPTQASQLSPVPAYDLPLVQYQDTSEDLVQAAPAMLRARKWTSEQKAYFEALIQAVSLPPLQTFKGHTNAVTALALLPNGLLASGSWDKTIKLWDIDLKLTLEELEQKAPECKMM